MPMPFEVSHRFGKVFVSLIARTVKGRTRKVIPMSPADADALGELLTRAAGRAGKYAIKTKPKIHTPEG